MATAPLDRLGRRKTTVALGPAFSQLKRLDGLPSEQSTKVLGRIVRENWRALFVHAGAQPHVSGVARDHNGHRWAAAFDSTVVNSVVAALRSRRIADIHVVTCVAAVAAAAPPGTHRLDEDGVALEITTSIEERVPKVTRSLAVPGSERTPAYNVPAIGNLADDASIYAIAYGAAMVSRRAQLTWHPEPDERRVRRFRISAQLAAASAFIVALAAAVLAPSIRVAQIKAQSTLASSRSGAWLTDAARVETELRRASAELEQIALFSAQRGRSTKLLGDLSSALPESTALASLRFDQREGSFVVLTPRAADVLPSLDSVSGILAQRIVGSIARETQGAARVDRFTVRFRRASRK